ncbi:MAG: response regulator transcription factor [Prolixibacteraceae bacterium]
MKKVNIYLVDDHALFREGLKFLLSGWEFADKIYEAENGQQFVDDLQQHPVDIALLDIEMPVMNGIRAAQLARELQPDIRIIALSMYTDEDYYTSMIESGADGFLLKNSKFSIVKQALEDVVSGKNYFSHEIIQLLVRHISSADRRSDKRITEREIEVLNYICLGLSNGEMAEKLQISKRTVDKHRQNLLDKTDSKNVVGLVLYAIKNGYYSIH